MNNIATSTIQDWIKNTSGDGTLTFNANNVCTATATATNAAYLIKYASVSAGEKITFRATCRVLSGSGQLIIDYPAVATPKNSVTIEGKEWKTYEISFIVPYTATLPADRTVRCNVGIFTSNAGELEIADAQILSSPRSAPVVRSPTYGMLIINTDGDAVINPNFANAGIVSVTKQDITPGGSASPYTKYTIATDYLVTSSRQSAPLFTISMSGTTTAWNYICKIGEFDYSTGAIDFAIVDVITGDRVKPADEVSSAWFLTIMSVA